MFIKDFMRSLLIYIWSLDIPINLVYSEIPFVVEYNSGFIAGITFIASETEEEEVLAPNLHNK